MLKSKVSLPVKQRSLYIGQGIEGETMRSIGKRHNLTSAARESRISRWKVFMFSIVILAQFYALAAHALSVEQSVASAILVDPQLKQTYSRMKSLESDQDFSFGDYLPTVTLTAGAGVDRSLYNQSAQTNDEAKKTELGLLLRQPIFSGLKTHHEVRRLGHEVQAERLKLYSEAEDVAIQVIEVYLELLTAQQVYELSKRNQSDHEKILEDVRTKVNNQLAARSDLAQIESRVANARASTIAAYNSMIDLQSRFELLVGLSPGDLIEPVANSMVLPATEEEAIKMAKENHYAILSALEDMKATDREFMASAGDYYPEVFLEMRASQDKYWDDGNGSSSTLGSHPNQGKTRDTTVMLKLEWDLFNGGKDFARRQGSRWRHQESLQLKESTERDIVIQVHQTWSAYTYLGEQVNFLQSNVDNSALAEQGYREQFRVGRRELLDVLIAKTDLFQARKSYLETQSRHLTATFRLKRIIGQLMPALSINFPRQWQEAE